MQYESWMGHVSNGTWGPHLWYCRQCNGVVFWCPDPACRCFHHLGNDCDAGEDLTAGQTHPRPLTDAQAKAYEDWRYHNCPRRG